MASIDEDFPLVDDAPAAAPAPVVGAPAPVGVSVPVPAIGKTWHPETHSWEPYKANDRVGHPAVASDPSLDEDFPLVTDTSHPTPSYEELKKSAEPTGDLGAMAAFLQAFISKPPIVGKYAGEFTDWASRKARALEQGIPEDQARKEVEAIKAATEKAHPTATTAGGITGTVNALTAAATALPEAFGVGATSYTAGMAAGGGSSVAIKLADDWLRDKPFDPVGTAITGVVGAGGGALATYLNKAFSAVVDPVVADLARWGISKDIPVQAGWVAKNPIIRKVPGELYAAGEKILPATAKSKAAEDAALDAWHAQIAKTIGSDAPRVTTKVLADTRKAIEDEGKQLTAVWRQNGNKLPDNLRAQADALKQRALDVRILEDVMKVNGSGQFTPQEFFEAVRTAVDKYAKTPAEEFAYGGGGDLAKAAQFGAAFLKTASAPAVDQHLGVALLKKALWSIASGAIPGAAYVLHGAEMTPAGIMGSIVGGVTALGKLAASHIAGAASRSPGIARQLLREGPQAGVPDAANAANAAALVRKATPGLVQQTVPLGGQLLRPATQPSQQP